MGDTFLTFEERSRLREAVSDAVRARVGRVGNGQSGRYRQRTSGDLSAREVEVLALAALGFTSPQMARMLGVCQGTVKDHLHHGRQKLGAATTTHAVALAVRQGLLEVAA